MTSETQRLEAMLQLAIRLRAAKGAERKPAIEAYVDAAIECVRSAREGQ